MPKIIQEKIDAETKNMEQPSLGEKKLEVVFPHATNFLKLYGKNDKESSESLEHLLKDHFVTWINSDPHEGFIEAYQMIITNISINSNTNSHLKLFFDLQFIYANTIHFIMNFKKRSGKEKFYDEIVPKHRSRDILQTTIQKLLGKLNLGYGGIHSRLESKMHLLQRLLEDLSSENSRNIFNATSTHSFVLREIMTKKIIQSLFLTYWKYNLDAPFVSNTALKMLSIFFNPMDPSDAAELAKEIKIIIKEDKQFRQQTIGNYIGFPS